ncbi:MAG: amidohydrolase family protein [Candidatus Poribacteria bacterium]|nr:amidohydrolase family protein [Candidatus Poribacteria bacterium]
MTIVDTHCHAGLNKYEPIESLLYHMECSGADKAVLIQHAGTTDNSYHVECLRAYPDRLSAAMIVETTDTGEKMRHWAAQGIVGIRLGVDSRADAADPLAQWRTAAELDLVVSAPARPSTLLGEAFAEVLRTFPDLQIVIEHLGGIGTEAEPPYDEFKQALALAKYPNLTIKLPGFGEFCKLPYPFEHVPPLARMVVDAFGPQRVMWGSDYPPVSSREGYDSSLKFPMEYFSDLSQTDREWIFGRTALSVWKFKNL